MNEKISLENDIRKIRSQLKKTNQSKEWRERAQYALKKKQRQLDELHKRQKLRAHNIKPSELVLLMYEGSDTEVREIARIFLKEKCGYEVK